MMFDHDAIVQGAIPLRPNSGLPEFGTLIGRSRIYPTSAGERSDRACAIRVRGISFTRSSPLTRNGREAPISDLSTQPGLARVAQRSAQVGQARLATGVGGPVGSLSA